MISIRKLLRPDVVEYKPFVRMRGDLYLPLLLMLINGKISCTKYGCIAVDYETAFERAQEAAQAAQGDAKAIHINAWVEAAGMSVLVFVMGFVTAAVVW